MNFVFLCIHYLEETRFIIVHQRIGIKEAESNFILVMRNSFSLNQPIHFIGFQVILQVERISPKDFEINAFFKAIIIGREQPS